MASFVRAETTSGRVRGIEVAGIRRFLGVRYGAPTGGSRRFRAPQPPKPWPGEREAFGYGPICPQLPPDPTQSFVLMQDLDVQQGHLGEDCLNLNLWTPGVSDGGKRPVLVYLHGGGWTRLSANHHLFNGDRLARFGDVVVVTLNHRLGALGYLNLMDLGFAGFEEAGVAGLLDVELALRWVRDNIANFGGDPQRVTLFGQSGGGLKISTLMGMPSAEGLFHGAFVQSGALAGYATREDAAKLSAALMRELGICADDRARLQDCPYEAIVEAQQRIGVAVGTPTEFKPFVDGHFLPAQPLAATRSSNPAPMVLGYCLNDSSWMTTNFALDEAGLKTSLARMTGGEGGEQVYALYRASYPTESPFLVRATAMTDRDLVQRVYGQAEWRSAAGARTWVYRFDWPSAWNGGTFGAVHGMDMALVFHNTNHAALGCSPDVHGLCRQMAGTLVAFATAGDPNTEDLGRWPEFTAQRKETMVINADHSRVVEDPAGRFRALWAKPA